jgi:PAS domain S-box-containing protein
MYAIPSLLILALLRYIKEKKSTILLNYLFTLNLLIYFDIQNITVILSYFLVTYLSINDKGGSHLDPGKILWDNSNDLIFIKDKNLNYYAVNDAWTRFNDTHENLVIGKGDFEIFNNELASVYRKSDEEAIELGSISITVEVPREGKKFYMMTIKQVIHNSEGEIIGLFGLSRDITDHHTAIRSLEEKNMIVEQLLKFSPNPIFIKNLDLIYTLVNNAYTKMHDKHLDQIIGKNDYELFEQETAVKFRADDRQVIDNKEIMLKEVMTIFAGRDQYSIVTKGPIIDIDGKVTGVIGMAHDITEYKRLEKEIHRTQKMESIGILAGGIAHDLNNILTGVSGYASLLQATLEDEESLEFVKQIIATNERASNLISKLLIFSSKQVEKVVSVDINSLIMDIYELLASSMRKSIEFSFNLNATSNIDGDQSQLNQVILNLIVNSIDSIKAVGEIHLKTYNRYIAEPNDYRYQTNKAKPGEFVVFSIKDSGIGISKQNIGKIFEPFFTTKDDQLVRGTGLGLSIVYGVVNELGGIISVESEVGKGTQIDIMFPKGLLVGKEKKQSPFQFTVGSGKILVIDDEEPILELLRNMLNRLGYEVITSSRGKEGIGIYEKNSSEIECVILDLLMPEIDGIKVFEELKKINSDIKVILSSGFGGKLGMEDLEEMGFDAILSKPYNLKELSKMLNKVIN